MICPAIQRRPGDHGNDIAGTAACFASRQAMPDPEFVCRIDTEADIAAGLDALLAADSRLKQVAAVAGAVPLRRRPGGFSGLASIVVSQQLSTASAGAIWGRLVTAYDPFTPQAFIRARA